MATIQITVSDDKPEELWRIAGTLVHLACKATENGVQPLPDSGDDFELPESFMEEVARAVGLPKHLLYRQSFGRASRSEWSTEMDDSVRESHATAPTLAQDPALEANVPATETPVVPAVPSAAAPEVDGFAATVPAPETPAVPTAPSVTTGVPLDSEGLPWDARIHSGGKSTIKDGTWKLRKGVDKDLVVSVKAELRQLMSIPTPPTPPVVEAPTVPTTPVVEAPTVPTPPVPAVEAPAATTDGPKTYGDLVRACTTAITAKQITMQQINTILAGKGLGNIQGTVNRPDLIPELWLSIQAEFVQ